MIVSKKASAWVQLRSKAEEILCMLVTQLPEATVGYFKIFTCQLILLTQLYILVFMV